MNDEDINNYMPSLLNPRKFRKCNGDISLTQNTSLSSLSLSLKRGKGNKNVTSKIKQVCPLNKENQQNKLNFFPANNKNVAKPRSLGDTNSIGFSAIDDIIVNDDNFSVFSHALEHYSKAAGDKKKNAVGLALSGKDLSESIYSDKTIHYDVHERIKFSVSFSVSNSNNVDISTEKSNIKNVFVTNNNNDINVDCELIEGSEISEETVANDLEMYNNFFSIQKRKAVAVNLEIKKQKLTTTQDKSENAKILILNTNDIEKLTHLIVQPPNYKLVKRKTDEIDKLKYTKRKCPYVSVIKHETQYNPSENLKQIPIDSYFVSNRTVKRENSGKTIGVKSDDRKVCDDGQEMIRHSGVVDYTGRTSHKTSRSETSKSPKISLPQLHFPKQEIKTSISAAPRATSSRSKRESIGSLSPRRNVDSVHYNLSQRPKQNKSTAQNIPHHKIVAGTHFAVDAFSYGPIPNVKHYFLTHFHSDHYTGLNRNFNKLLFCSKITADLCVSSLGVNSKYINVIKIDETINIDGVEVTPVDANHCPGALMLVFTLPNGKTILHTGDFRAAEFMESYPVFWNKDIHTIYLDTTYCNPRYDFPPQDQSLEIAVNLLRQKKIALERVGKKFSSVLLVCGTYTIGKEKFFEGISKRVGCSIWTCPEKNRIMQTLEGKTYSHNPPQSCQLHVVSMRDLTYEKLRSYLASLKGAFSEVVAFKPSGWENAKNTTFEKDCVTIHGIPYSEHSSFSELIRFVKFLKPKQVIPTVYISGGVKSVQKYFPCSLISKEDILSQSRVTDYFSTQKRQQVPAVT